MNGIQKRITVFELGSTPSAFCNFAFVDQANDKLFRLFDGRSHTERWTLPAITAADEPDATAELGDFAFLGTIPVLSARAVRELRTLIESRAEILPLRYSRREYYALNVLRVVDALDEESSEIERFDNGRVMAINRFSFRPDALNGETIFRIPQLQRGYTFVTDSFVERVQAHELLGFSFKKVWCSADSGNSVA